MSCYIDKITNERVQAIQWNGTLDESLTEDWVLDSLDEGRLKLDSHEGDDICKLLVCSQGLTYPANPSDYVVYHNRSNIGVMFASQFSNRYERSSK